MLGAVIGGPFDRGRDLFRGAKIVADDHPRGYFVTSQPIRVPRGVHLGKIGLNHCRGNGPHVRGCGLTIWCWATSSVSEF